MAITGHKLQGLSMDKIVVYDFDYGKLNWNYVVLSRVRTLSGLFLMKPLSYEKLMGLEKRSMIESKEKLKFEDERLRALGG